MNKKLLNNLEFTATAVTFARYLRETDYDAFIKLLILESGASNFDEFKKMINDTSVNTSKKETEKPKSEEKVKAKGQDKLEELDKEVDKILNEFDEDFLKSDQDDEEKEIEDIFLSTDDIIKGKDNNVEKKEIVIKTLKDVPDGYLLVSPFGTIKLINKDNLFFNDLRAFDLRHKKC